MTTINALKKEIKKFPRAIDGRIQYPVDFKLRALQTCKDLGMTQAAFSKAMGFSYPSTLNKWSKSLRNVDINRDAISVTRLRAPESPVQAILIDKRADLQAKIKNLSEELKKVDTAIKLLNELGC